MNELIKKLSFVQKTGLLTDLHSDTIFGHFCWRLLHGEGIDTLRSFLEEFYSNNTTPIFTVSNAFPGIKDKIFLPFPLLKLSYLKESNEAKKDYIVNFLKFKEFKKISSIPISDFNLLLSGNTSNFVDSILDKIESQDESPSFVHDLRTRVKISRETFSSEEGLLFSQESRSISGTHDQIKNGEIRWNVFIKVLNKEKFECDEFKCEKYLKEVFSLGFGKKKNIGYGEFVDIKWDNFDSFEQPEAGSNGFITLGNYLPAAGDGLKNMRYKQFLKYPKLGEEFSKSDDPFKKPIVFFLPGSVFYTDKVGGYYGRCTNPGDISSSKVEVIQNGYAFSLRANLPALGS